MCYFIANATAKIFSLFSVVWIFLVLNVSHETMLLQNLIFDTLPTIYYKTAMHKYVDNPQRVCQIEKYVAFKSK